MDKKHVYDMVIVGGGPGGYTAALYAARAGLDARTLSGLLSGRKAGFSTLTAAGLSSLGAL